MSSGVGLSVLPCNEPATGCNGCGHKYAWVGYLPQLMFSDAQDIALQLRRWTYDDYDHVLIRGVRYVIRVPACRADGSRRVANLLECIEPIFRITPLSARYLDDVIATHIAPWALRRVDEMRSTITPIYASSYATYYDETEVRAYFESHESRCSSCHRSWSVWDDERRDVVSRRWRQTQTLRRGRPHIWDYEITTCSADCERIAKQRFESKVRRHFRMERVQRRNLRDLRRGARILTDIRRIVKERSYGAS